MKKKLSTGFSSRFALAANLNFIQNSKMSLAEYRKKVVSLLY